MGSTIDEINIKYNSWNDNYYISIINKENKEIWYTYEIICSHNTKNNKILWAKNMIIISKKVKSKIIKNDKDDKITEAELDKFLIKNKEKHKYINIISNKVKECKIYIGLKNIIKN